MKLFLLLGLFSSVVQAQTLTYQLFGPVQSQGALIEDAAPLSWHFPGYALTASTKAFYFDFPMKQVKFARWVIVWTGNNIYNKMRLVHMDDGPANITEICVLESNGSQLPVVQGCTITDQINTLINGGLKKHIGFQVQGVTEYTLYESRLELVF